MMSADMSSTLSPSMPVLKRMSPDVPRIYARGKFYARPMPTLQMTSPSPTHKPAPENKASTVPLVQGARDERAQSVIKLAVTVKSGVKTMVIAPQPKVMVVRVEDAVRLGRLESRSNGRYRVRQEPTKLQPPATQRPTNQHGEACTIPSSADKALKSTCVSGEPKIVSGQPEDDNVQCSLMCVNGLNNVPEEVDQGPPVLTMDDYYAKLTEEKGKMINRVFARIASVSNSHEDQQKNAAATVGVIRRPEYEDISDDDEDLARETFNSQPQHVLRNASQISSDNSPETAVVNRRENGVKDTLELLSVLEGTDHLTGGNESTPRRQLHSRRTSAPGLVETTQSPLVALQKITRSASLTSDGDSTDQPPRYPKMRFSRCSRRNWKVLVKSPLKTNIEVATNAQSPICAEACGEVASADRLLISGETRVITSTDKSVRLVVQPGAESVTTTTTPGAQSGDHTSLPRNLESSVVVCARGSIDATPVIVKEGKPVSDAAVIDVPLSRGASDGDKTSSDAVRRLSEEKSNARPELIPASSGAGIVNTASKDMSARVHGQMDLNQGEVETIMGTEIPVLNDLGLGATKEVPRKRGRPPLQSLKKDKVRSSTPPLPTPKKTIARKKSTSRRNFRHESIQTFKPTTAPPPWRYKGRAHVRSPDITLAPQRKLSVDLQVEPEIDPVSSPSPNDLVIDLNPDRTETDGAGDLPEVVNVAEGRGSSSTESSLRRALSDPGNCGATSVYPKGVTKDTAADIPERQDLSPTAPEDDCPDGVKKRRKKDEGGDVVQAVHARLATKHHHEKGRRLAQELPGYNWLEEKILNGGGVKQVMPPKIAAMPPICASDIPEVAMRLASVTESLVITKVQNVQQPDATGASAQLASVDVQKPAFGEHEKIAEQMQSVERERHDSIARRTLIQLANGGDMQVTMERVPHENTAAVNCDPNDKRRYEETYVAKQLLHEFNAKNQMNQENRKRMETLASQQRNCAANLPAAKPPPATWGFADNVATMARHTATSFDTGVGLTRGYPGPMPQEILPPGNPRIASGMTQVDHRTASHHLAPAPPHSAHSAHSVSLPCSVPALPPGGAEHIGVRRSSREHSISPQYPPEMYRTTQMVDAPLNASREQNHKLTGETAEAHHNLHYEQQKLRGVHPRPAVPTATAAATARSLFPSLPEPAQTQPIIPIRHQQVPHTHQLQDHRVNSSLAQSHSNAKRDERNSHISLPPQMIQGFKEPPFTKENVCQIPPQFIPGSQFAQHQNSLHIAQSPEMYRDSRIVPGKNTDMRSVPINYAPTQLLQQTLLNSDGRSRPAQEAIQRKSQGGQVPIHRSPTEQAAVPSSVKEHLNSQMFIPNNQYVPMPQMNPNLPPQALHQLRQQEKQKTAEKWRNEMERGRFVQTTRAEATPASRISPNASTRRFTSPQQGATNQLGHASIYDGPLNNPFQLPPFSPPFSSVPGPTVYRPPMQPQQQSFKAPPHSYIDMVRPANPQNDVTNYQQQIPYNFQQVCNVPAQYPRNDPTEYLELLKKKAAQLEFEEFEAKRRQIAQQSAMKKEAELHRATRREIARLEAERAKTFKEAAQEEERLRLQANLAARHEPHANHAQVPWNNMIHHQMLHHQSRDQQTVSPRSMHQQQRVQMSGGHVSPRYVQQQISPQVAGAELVINHHPKFCSQDPPEIQQMKMQQQMNNQVTQVPQYPQFIQQQKQKTPSSQQAQAQMNALHESQRQMREHEHRILQQQQNQRAVKNPSNLAPSPNQSVKYASAIGSHHGTILQDSVRQEKQQIVEAIKQPISLTHNNDKDISVDRDVSRVAHNKKVLQEAREMTNLMSQTVSGHTTALPLETKKKIVESRGPSNIVKYQSGTKLWMPVKESMGDLHRRSDSLEKEAASDIPNKNTPSNKVNDEGLQHQPQQTVPGDNSSKIKPLPPLHPLPQLVKKLPELEKLLVNQGDLHTTVPANSDPKPISSSTSGETGAPIDIVKVDTSADDPSKEVKFMPRAHQASWFSTATIKSGKKRFIHRLNVATKYAADSEPMDLSATKSKAADVEIVKPHIKIAPSSIVARWLQPIIEEKTTETRAESFPLENVPESQPMIAVNEIKEKSCKIYQKTPPQTKVIVESGSENRNQLNTTSPLKSTQNVVEASTNSEVNGEKADNILSTNQSNVVNDVISPENADSAGDSDPSKTENDISADSKRLGSLESSVKNHAALDPVEQEIRSRSYSDSDGDEKMKVKYQMGTPINSQDDNIYAIEEARRNLENGSIAENLSDPKASATVSDTNFNAAPTTTNTALPQQLIQVRETVVSFHAIVTANDIRKSSKGNLANSDGKEHVQTYTTVLRQTGKTERTYLEVSEQDSVRQSIIHNKPTVQNVAMSGSNSEEPECPIQIASIFSVKDVHPDGTYNECSHLSENEGKEPVKKTSAKVLTKQRSLPNTSSPPFSYDTRGYGKEDPSFVQGTPKIDRTNICQKRKSSGDPATACLSEEPTARKVHRPANKHRIFGEDTDEARQKHLSTENYPTCEEFVARDSHDQSDDCIIVEDDPTDVLPTSRDTPGNSQTRPTPDAGDNSSPENLVDDVPMCDVCGATATCSCSICLYVYYCSRECQKNHWSVHSVQCKRWAAKRRA